MSLIKNKLKAKVIINVLIGLAVIFLSCGVLYASIERIRIDRELKEEQISRTNNIEQILMFSNNAMFKYINVAMNIFKRANDGGYVITKGNKVKVGDKEVYDILLNNKSQALNNELIDKQLTMTRTISTIFTRDGDDFIRITTNIPTASSMSIGSKLDPKGDALKALKKGEAYYGIVHILDVDDTFYAGYEPIIDNKGEIIGAWFVGYRVSDSILKILISNTRILKNGFIAVMDSDGNIILHSSHVDHDKIKNALNNSEEWSVIKKMHNGLTVISAYSNFEVTAKGVSELIPLSIFGIILYIAIAFLFNFIVDFVIVKLDNKVRFL